MRISDRGFFHTFLLSQGVFLPDTVRARRVINCGLAFFLFVAKNVGYAPGKKRLGRASLFSSIPTCKLQAQWKIWRRQRAKNHVFLQMNEFRQRKRHFFNLHHKSILKRQLYLCPMSNIFFWHNFFMEWLWKVVYCCVLSLLLVETCPLESIFFAQALPFGVLSKIAYIYLEKI